MASKSLDEKDMITIANILTEKDVELLKREYNDQSFGSWFIEARKSDKLARLVFDGKDYWLIYQIKIKPDNTDEFRKKFKTWGEQILWKDIEVDKTIESDGGNPQLIAEKFLKLLE